MTLESVAVHERVGGEGVEMLESTWLGHWECREDV